MKTKASFFYLLTGLIFLSACSSEIEPSPSAPDGSEYNFVYNFDKEEDWQVGFADYPVEGEDLCELDYRISTLPPNLNSQKRALKISGHNRSDDLFMFFKRKINGLLPSTTYEIVFDIEFASNAPRNSIGIGGSPGASVYLKAGAVPMEPKVYEVNNEGQRDWKLTIDKGNQSKSGRNMIVLGNIGTDNVNFDYCIVKRNNSKAPFKITTNEQGEFWFIAGTDSGFEGLTTLYYTNVRLKVKQPIL